MEIITSKVYIKVDSNNNIIAIDGGYSISNITDFSQWIMVDEGTGDRYNLCQQNYLSKPIIEEHGLYQYSYVNRQIVEKDLTAEIEEIKKREALENELASLNEWLSAHDYIGTKIATGRASIADYAEEIALMNQYSMRINRIKEMLSECVF